MSDPDRALVNRTVLVVTKRHQHDLLRLIYRIGRGFPPPLSTDLLHLPTGYLLAPSMQLSVHYELGRG